MKTPLYAVFTSFLCVAAVAGGDDGRDWSKIYLGSCPSVNADGSRFVFEWNDSIWIAPTAGGTAERLTPEESRESWPALSPDGTRVAFLSSRDGENKIFVMDLATLRVSQVSRHSEPTGLSGWAPDGKRLVGGALRDHAGDASTGWRIAFFSPDGGETYPFARRRAFSRRAAARVLTPGREHLPQAPLRKGACGCGDLDI